MRWTCTWCGFLSEVVKSLSWYRKATGRMERSKLNLVQHQPYSALCTGYPEVRVSWQRTCRRKRGIRDCPLLATWPRGCDFDDNLLLSLNRMIDSEPTQQARSKTSHKRFQDDLPVHSLNSLLAHLGTLVRNQCHHAGAAEDKCLNWRHVQIWLKSTLLNYWELRSQFVYLDISILLEIPDTCARHGLEVRIRKNQFNSF